MLDLVLAVLHHLLVFALLAVLVAELMLVRVGLGRPQVAQVSRLDAGYGLLAIGILAIGFSRAVFAAKGWDYYAHNLFFWAKIVTFAIIGLLSAIPTLAMLRWRKTEAPPVAAQVRSVRRILHLELALFALLPIFAAAMARGYGEMN